MKKTTSLADFITSSSDMMGSLDSVERLAERILGRRQARDKHVAESNFSDNDKCNFYTACGLRLIICANRQKTLRSDFNFFSLSTVRLVVAHAHYFWV